MALEADQLAALRLPQRAAALRTGVGRRWSLEPAGLEGVALQVPRLLAGMCPSHMRFSFRDLLADEAREQRAHRRGWDDVIDVHVLNGAERHRIDQRVTGLLHDGLAS